MRVTVTPLEPHPNDPANGRPDTFQLPTPRLTPVYRLEAELGPPLDLGDTAHGHRRIVPLTGGTFTGSRISGRLVPGGSANWQTVLPDGTALGDIRYTLQTDDGALLDVRSRGLRHGGAEVLARLAPAMRSTPVSTRFARRPRSRPPHPSSAGSTRGSSSQSAAAAGRRDLRDLSGGMKVAIITGASQGIGAGLVAGLRGCRYAVVGTSRSIPSSDEPDYLTVQGEIADAQTAEQVVERALERFGRIDTLINNAGIYIGKPFTDYTADDYAAITTANLAGFFHITQRAIRQMLRQGGGHVVNVSTSLVDHADRDRRSPLSVLTKGAPAAAARSLAIEYASRGVRVNAISLGVIKTPTHDPASHSGMEDLHPLGRLGEISDVVDAILCLERATFVTGTTLHIDAVSPPDTEATSPAHANRTSPRTSDDE
jgi:NAD(P)-dependent dehydrogenase (short-subunit alcohol dehydrogenase family)